MAMIEFLTSEQVDVLTTPLGTLLEILTVEGNNDYFVKTTHVTSSLGYKNSTGSTRNTFFAQTTEKLGVKSLSVYGVRLGRKIPAIFGVVNVNQVVPILNQMESDLPNSNGARDAQRKKKLQVLRDWWKKQVLPKYGTQPILEEETVAKESVPLFDGEEKQLVDNVENASTIIDKIYEQAKELSGKINVPLETALKAVAKLESSRRGYDLSPLLEILTKGE